MTLAYIDLALCLIATICLGAAYLVREERPQEPPDETLPPYYANYFEPLFSEETLDEIEHSKWQD